MTALPLPEAIDAKSSAFKSDALTAETCSSVGLECNVGRLSGRCHVRADCSRRRPEPAQTRRSDASDLTLTYGELDSLANQLAHQLRHVGAKPGTFVGSLPRSHAGSRRCPVGGLKTGAAYLPLDPSYPRDRLAFMLDDARPILVTQEQYAGLAPQASVQRACSMIAPRAIDAGRRGNPDVPIKQQDRAPMSSTRRVRRASPRALRFRTAPWSTSCARCGRTGAHQPRMCLRP